MTTSDDDVANGPVMWVSAMTSATKFDLPKYSVGDSTWRRMTVDRIVNIPSLALNYEQRTLLRQRITEALDDQADASYENGAYDNSHACD